MILEQTDNLVGVFANVLQSNMKPNPALVGGVRRRFESSLAGIKGKIDSHRNQIFHPTIFKSKQWHLQPLPHPSARPSSS